jgi:hypothetical protein
LLRLGTDLRRRAAGQGLDLDPAIEEDDDLVNQLIEHNPAFRELLSRSIASPREPFPFDEP